MFDHKIHSFIQRKPNEVAFKYLWTNWEKLNKKKYIVTNVINPNREKFQAQDDVPILTNN